jgi:hypothetical protein
MRNKFTLSTSIKKIGDSVVLFKDKYVKHSYLYVDPKCEFRANNSGFTRENTGVVLEDHFDMNGIPRSHKIMVNNGNTGWIPAEYLESVQSCARG